MSFDQKQFREVIRCVLEDFDKKMLSDAAVELLMMTAAHESRLGTKLYQDDGDVEIEGNLAAGVMQIEPFTYKDIINRFVGPEYPELKPQPFHTLITDIKQSIIIARLKYWDYPEPLPAADNVPGLARYYKRYYNTAKGKARTAQVMRDYQELCF